MEKTFLKINKAVSESDKILLVSHEEPDGDALGSMLALKIVFDRLDKGADVFCLSEIPERLKFLPRIDEVKKNANPPYDLILGLDYGDLKRLETVVAELQLPLPMITLDHHQLANQSGQLKVIDPDFSSTCEIVYRFLETNEMEIDKEIATCLLTGIFTDTWSFRHSNASAKTLKIAGELILKGAFLNKIAKIVSQSDVGSKTKIWGRALSNINFDNDGFVSCFVNRQEMEEFQATPDDLSGLASLLCMVPGAKFSLVLSEGAPGQLNGSLRALSEQGANVAELAKEIGGGGHELSAGFKTTGKPEDIIARIKKLIKTR